MRKSSMLFGMVAGVYTAQTNQGIGKLPCGLLYVSNVTSASSISNEGCTFCADPLSLIQHPLAQVFTGSVKNKINNH